VDKIIEELIGNWQKRNIPGLRCVDKEQATERILADIPVDCSIGFSGSLTLEQLGIIRRLESRGNQVFNPYKPGISSPESLKLRRQGAVSEYYLCSPNAISASGELVFLSAYGNRTAGISYAQHVIAVAGVNKIAPDLAQALKRAREYAAPLNCKRLNYNTPCFSDGICRKEICFAPEYKRMCCQVLVIEAEIAPDRLKVILVGENLGF